MPEEFNPPKLYFGIINDGAVSDMHEIHGTFELSGADDPYWSDDALYLQVQPLTFNVAIEDQGVLNNLFAVADEPQHTSIAIEQRWSRRRLPRTIRDAKMRPKGNRGNKRREMSYDMRRYVYYDVIVERGDSAW